MNNIVVFGPTQTGKTTLLGYLSTAMLRHPQFNEEVYKNLKKVLSLSELDEFKIGNPQNPISVAKDIILPSFVSLDRDELRRFKNIDTEGTTKRLHRKQLVICLSDRGINAASSDSNANILCTFIDTPGFRMRTSDKYRGIFEGEIGVAVLSIRDVLKFIELSDAFPENDENKLKLERKIFEPLRIWCEYKSAHKLIIVLSKIDLELPKDEINALDVQRERIMKAVNCIESYTERFNNGIDIPITPISITINKEDNVKKSGRMSVFFKRKEVNIYAPPEGNELPGAGTFISCLREKIEPLETPYSDFSFACIEKALVAIVNNKPKSALRIKILHGALDVKSNVMIGPFVVNDEENRIAFAQCEISSLKADGAKKEQGTLFEGNVGGIILKNIEDCETGRIYNISTKRNDSDIILLKSTILYAGSLITGDIISVSINKDEFVMRNGDIHEIYNNVLLKIMPKDQLHFYWYGKKVYVEVIEIETSSNRIILGLMPKIEEINLVHTFAAPCNEKGKVKYHDNLLLAVIENSLNKRGKSGTPIYNYINTNIIDIKDSYRYDKMEIILPNENQYQRVKNEFGKKITCEDHLRKLIVPIKHNLKSGSTLRNIVNRIKEQLPRKKKDKINYTNEGICLRLIDEI